MDQLNGRLSFKASQKFIEWRRMDVAFLADALLACHATLGRKDCVTSQKKECLWGRLVWMMCGALATNPNLVILCSVCPGVQDARGPQI